jgi:RNA polymerase sigma factor (sigma-70 family)
MCRKNANGACEIGDLVQAARVALLLAFERYDPTLGGNGSSFAWHQVRSAINREIARMRRPICIPESSSNKSDVYTPDVHVDAASDEAREYRLRLLGVASPTGRSEKDCEWAVSRLGLLTAEERRILELHFGLEMNDRKIAILLGCGHRRICKIRNRALQKLRKECVDNA